MELKSKVADRLISKGRTKCPLWVKSRHTPDSGHLRRSRTSTVQMLRKDCPTAFIILTGASSLVLLEEERGRPNTENLLVFYGVGSVIGFFLGTLI